MLYEVITVNTQNYVLDGSKVRGTFKPDPNKSYTIQLSAFRFPVYLSHFRITSYNVCYTKLLRAPVEYFIDGDSYCDTKSGVKIGVSNTEIGIAYILFDISGASKGFQLGTGVV